MEGIRVQLKIERRSKRALFLLAVALGCSEGMTGLNGSEPGGVNVPSLQTDLPTETSPSEKVQQGLELIGKSWDPVEKATVFGQAARIAKTWKLGMEEFFKSYLWGHWSESSRSYSPHSFLAQVDELRTLLAANGDIPEASLDRFLALLGQEDEAAQGTLFGAIRAAQLTQHEGGASFLEALGPTGTVEEPELTSCRGLMAELRALTAPSIPTTLPDGFDSLHFWLGHLSQNGTLQLQRDMKEEEKTPGSLTSEKFKEAIVNDLYTRLVGEEEFSLLRQVEALNQFLKDEGRFDEALFCLGDASLPLEGADLDGYTVATRLRRLATSLRNFADILPMTTLQHLEDILFSGVDSFQNRLYELWAHVCGAPGQVLHVIGGASSRDESLLGLLNRALKQVESDPFTVIFRQSRSLEETLASISASEVSLLAETMGIREQPLAPYVNKILDVFPYIACLWEETTFLRPYSELQALAPLVFSALSSKGQVTLESLFLSWLAETSVTKKLELSGSVKGEPSSNSLWGCAKGLLNTLLARLAFFLQNEISPFLAMGITEESKVSLSEAFQLRQKLLEELIQRGQSSFLRLDVAGFLEPFFERGLVLQRPRLETGVVSAESSAEETLPAWTALSSTLSVAEALRLIDTSLHALLLRPILGMLQSTGQDGDTELTARERLRDIRDHLQPYGQLASNEIQILGQPGTPLSRETATNPTLSELFQEVVTLLSIPEFFVPVFLEALQQLRGQEVTNEAEVLQEGAEEDLFTLCLSNSWPLAVVSRLGTPYDTETDPLFRTFFGALKTLQDTLQQDDLRPHLTTFQLALGTSEDLRTSTNHSCFSTLYFILLQILEKSLPLLFHSQIPYTPYLQTLVGELAVIRHQFDLPEYAYSNLFTSIEKIGTPEPETGLFSQCAAYLERWPTCSVNELQPAALTLLVGAREVGRLMDDFCYKLATLTPEQCESFVSKMLGGVSYMLRLDACEGCTLLVPCLQETELMLRDLGGLFEVLAQQDTSPLFEKASFSGLRRSSEACQQVLQNLSHVFGPLTSTKCALLSSKGAANSEVFPVLNSLNEALRGIREELRSFINTVGVTLPGDSSPMTFTDAKGSCAHVVVLVNRLADHLLTIANNLGYPAASSLPYVAQNVEDGRALLAVVQAMQDNLQSLSKATLCPQCLLEGLDMDRLQTASQLLVSGVADFSGFLEKTEFSTLALLVDRIRKVLENIASYPSVLSSSEMLFDRLSTPTLESFADREVEAWEALISPLQNVMKILQQFPLGHAKAEASLLSLEAALQQIIQPVKEWSYRLGLAPSLFLSEEIEECPYANESFPDIFEFLMAAVQRLCQQWNSTAEQIQAFPEGVRDLWVLRWLERHEKLQEALAACLPTEQALTKVGGFFLNTTDVFKVIWPQHLRTLRTLLIGTEETEGMPQGLAGAFRKARQHLQDSCPSLFLQRTVLWQRKVADLAHCLVEVSSTHTTPNTFLKTLLSEGLPPLQKYEEALLQLIDSNKNGHCLHTIAASLLPSLTDLCDSVRTAVESLAAFSSATGEIFNGEGNNPSQDSHTVLLLWLQAQLEAVGISEHDVLWLNELESFVTLCTTLHQHARTLASYPACLAQREEPDKIHWQAFWNKEAESWAQYATLVRDFLKRQQSLECYERAITVLDELQKGVAQLLNHLISASALAPEEEEVLFSKVHNFVAHVSECLESLWDDDKMCWGHVLPFIEILATDLRNLWSPSTASDETTLPDDGTTARSKDIPQAVDSLVKTVQQAQPSLRQKALIFRAEEADLPLLPYALALNNELQRLASLLATASVRVRKEPLSLEGSSLIDASEVLAQLAESCRRGRDALSHVLSKMREFKKATEGRNLLDQTAAQLAPDGIPQPQVLKNLEIRCCRLRAELTAGINQWVDKNYRPGPGTPQPLPFYAKEDQQAKQPPS